jgi:hypothetical protein
LRGKVTKINASNKFETFFEKVKKKKKRITNDVKANRPQLGRDSSAIHLVGIRAMDGNVDSSFSSLIITVIARLLRTFSCWAFRFEFQQNSKMATTMAIARPHSRTTNTPPIVILADAEISFPRRRTNGTRWAAEKRTKNGQSVKRQFKSRKHEERKRERESSQTHTQWIVNKALYGLVMLQKKLVALV